MKITKNHPFVRFLNQLADIPATEIDKVTAVFHPTQLQKNAFFIRAGEIPQSLGFVTSGILRLYYLDENGTEFTKSFCTENDVVAAYSALLLNQPSRLFIQALADTTLLVAPYAAYQTLVAGHPCRQTVNQKLAEALFIKKEQRESELLLDDAQTRYMTFLADYPDLEDRIKQHHIASYLGITPESLSRIRSRLRIDKK